jgi:glycosyltransferase involved in cell wall biosynthesis
MSRDEIVAQPTKPSSFSVFFPAYNDSLTIASLIEDAHSVLSGITNNYEIIVVNDGSQDGTGPLLDKLAEKDSKLRVFHHPRNRGYGGALITGLSQAKNEWVFYTDGDGQYDVKELALLIAAIRPGVGLVNGYKVARSDPWYRKVLGGIYQKLVSVAFDLKTVDPDCDFRLIQRKILQEISLRSTSGVICVELVSKIQRTGCQIAQVPVSHFERKAGQSQFFSVRHLSRTVVQLPKLWLSLILVPAFKSVVPDVFRKGADRDLSSIRV